MPSRFVQNCPLFSKQIDSTEKFIVEPVQKLNLSSDPENDMSSFQGKVAIITGKENFGLGKILKKLNLILNLFVKQVCNHFKAEI